MLYKSSFLQLQLHTVPTFTTINAHNDTHGINKHGANVHFSL